MVGRVEAKGRRKEAADGRSRSKIERCAFGVEGKYKASLGGQKPRL